MAAPLSRLGTFIIFFILIFSFNKVNGDDEGILSRLYQQAYQENRPVILVLSNSDAQISNDMGNPWTSDKTILKQVTRDPYLELYHLAKTNKKFKALGNKGSVDRQRRRPKNGNKKIRFGPWIRQNKYYDNDNRYGEIQDSGMQSRFINGHDKHQQIHPKRGVRTKKVLRSPLFRNFLRYSNSLRCATRDDCADECSDKFVGNKKDECEEKCENKFECEESTEEDPCEKGECEESNECGQDGCNVSTKGITFVTETPKCKRC